MVLLHHSVVNYTHFGNGDKARWLGFDLVVLFDDSFFMISGLFVLPRRPRSKRAPQATQSSQSFNNFRRRMTLNVPCRPGRSKSAPTSPRRAC
jgi:hypothetical protein